MMADSSAGKAKVKSDRRITPSSTQPRRAEASAPAATPSPRPISTATTPTRIEVRAPTSSCETMSRPRLSVPSQCAALGGASLLGMSISVAGQGVHTSDSSALATNSAVSALPSTKLGLRRARDQKPGRAHASLVFRRGSTTA